MKRAILSMFLVGAAALAVPAPLLAQEKLSDNLPPEKRNAANAVEAIDMIWSGHRVANQMIMRGDHQFIVYYDASRQMSIAHREKSDRPWRYHKLPSYLGWDSHNYATIDVDELGYIHVMGNMHTDPIIYFRSTEPWQIRTLKQQEFLADKAREQRVTYPTFLHDDEGRLIARFRVGSSGDGYYYFHLFNPETMSWSLLHNQQFTSGEGERGTYFQGPEKGPDAYFHTIWVWRETPSANTNNNLSYARSRDLVNWEDSNGKQQTLPITRSAGEIIDPVPVGGGMLNGQTKLGFDAENKPMIAYYKHDQKGDTQIFLARKTGMGWTSHQISDWNGSRQDLDKGGSLTVSVLVPQDPYVADDGSIRVRARWNGDPYEFIVDAKTNRTTGETAYIDWPESITSLRDNPELTQYVSKAQGIPANSPFDYFISWEAQASFQDRARPTIPAPVTLRLHTIPK